MLVYRTLSAIAALHVMDRPVTIEMGTIDSSGYDAGPNDWVQEVPEISERIRQAAPTAREDPGFGYWVAASADLWVAFEVESGDIWSRAGERLNLAVRYERCERTATRLTADVLSFATR